MEKNGTNESSQKMPENAKERNCVSPASTEEWYLDPLGIGMGVNPVDGDSYTQVDTINEIIALQVALWHDCTAALCLAHGISGCEVCGVAMSILDPPRT